MFISFHSNSLTFKQPQAANGDRPGEHRSRVQIPADNRSQLLHLPRYDLGGKYFLGCDGSTRSHVGR